jgi:predicted unusual protein kinase regulating ubiquinone biosynthesis (AarF/ABC1/UbiB family)
MPHDEPPDLEELPRGFRQRTLATALLAARLGRKMAKRQLFGGKEPTDAQTARDLDKAVAAAEDLVEKLGGLKGLVMKVGQIASYMPGAMPPEAQRVLARLQARSTAMSWDAVAAVIEAELGEPAERAFDAIDRVPFAAASIGQVHSAVIDGRAVAVKVQYPGIEDAIAADLRTVRKLGWMASLGTAMDSGVVLDELAARTLEECDYVREADNQRLFRDLWAGRADVRVPDVVAARSSRRVLTSELVRGETLEQFAARAPQAARDRAGATVFWAAFHTVFHRGVFNGDPHPGNYLFEDERVTFLDFGCVRRFDRAEIELWKGIAREVLDDDRAGFRRRFLEAGFVPSPKKFDWDAQWASMEYLYRPLKQRAPFRYSHDYVSQSYGVLLFDNPNQRRTAMPGSWVYLNRLQWGLNSVLAGLEASGPWRELYRAAIDSPTAPC